MGSKTYYARAPLRISFAGGGTDVDAFAARYGGCVTSVTIARYVWAAVTPGPRGHTLYPLAQSDAQFPTKLANHFPEAHVELQVDAPPHSGLGASGAIGVATLGALDRAFGRNLTRTDLANLAHQIETQELGVPGGRQDQAAAAFGGMNHIVFDGNGFEVAPIELTSALLLGLESSLVLVFAGVRPWHSGGPMADELARLEQGDEKVVQALLDQKRLAIECELALRQCALYRLGELLDQSWQAKKRQSRMATSPRIDEIYEVGRRAGALGGKICGAGGGGYFVFLAPGRAGPVGEALRQMGLMPERVSIDTWGLRTWTS